MPDAQNYNLDYRPESYWDDPRAAYANVKGEVRRRKIQQAELLGQLESLPPLIFADDLPEEIRHWQSSIAHELTAGEYLPDYQPGEIEIARVLLRSVNADVIAVRACAVVHAGQRRIRYCIVDEDGCGPRYEPGIAESAEPLTFGELIHLLDRTKLYDGKHFIGYGLVTWFRDWTFCPGAPPDLYIDKERAELNPRLKPKGDPASFKDYTSVSSMFYPELGAWYAEVADEWLIRRRKELGLKDDDEAARQSA
jgi:hypothetical protein